MKDEIRIYPSDTHGDICQKVSDWLEYYNNDRPQWKLDKLTPVEYYSYVMTGIYPLATKPQSVLRREKLLGDKTVEDMIVDEENEKLRRKAEKAKLKKMAANGIRSLPESGGCEADDTN